MIPSTQKKKFLCRNENNLESVLLSSAAVVCEVVGTELSYPLFLNSIQRRSVLPEFYSWQRFIKLDLDQHQSRAMLSERRTFILLIFGSLCRTRRPGGDANEFRRAVRSRLQMEIQRHLPERQRQFFYLFIFFQQRCFEWELVTTGSSQRLSPVKMSLPGHSGPF